MLNLSTHADAQRKQLLQHSLKVVFVFDLMLLSFACRWRHVYIWRFAAGLRPTKQLPPVDNLHSAKPMWVRHYTAAWGASQKNNENKEPQKSAQFIHIVNNSSWHRRVSGYTRSHVYLCSSISDATCMHIQPAVTSKRQQAGQKVIDDLIAHMLYLFFAVKLCWRLHRASVAHVEADVLEIIRYIYKQAKDTFHSSSYTGFSLLNFPKT